MLTTYTLTLALTRQKTPTHFVVLTVTREEIQILTSKNSLLSIVFTVVDCAIVNEMK